MNCEIVTIGSELLLGQIIDTPEGSIPIPNEVGTAPGFIIEKGTKVIIALPGVPKELKYILNKEIVIT